MPGSFLNKYYRYFYGFVFRRINRLLFKTGCKIFFILLLITISSALLCGRKKETQPKELSIKFNSDSLEKSFVIEVLEGPLVADRDTLKAVFLCLLERVGEKNFGITNNDTLLFEKLAEQLSMRTNLRWTKGAAKFLLQLAKLIKIQSDKYGSISVAVEELRKYMLDSINIQDTIMKKAMAILADSLLTYKKGAGGDIHDSTFFIIEKLLGLSRNAVILLWEFVEPPKELKNADYAQMTKGLIYEPGRTEQPKKQKIKQSPISQIKDNSALALKYRDQQSIHNSILKHRINLESIYKKHLKLDSKMAGTVWVTFKVAPNGDVVDINISRTDINGAAFLEQLIKYLQGIKFKAIADEIGIMVFEYPFTFTPDL